MQRKRRIKQGSPNVRRRTGTRKNVQFSDTPPPLVSCGTLEREILYALKTKVGRFSIRGYESQTGRPKSSVSSALKRLMQKKLVERKNYGNYQITEYGLNLLEVTGFGQDDRRVGRGKLNMHRIEYKCKISGGDISKIKSDALEVKSRKMNNWIQHDCYFSNGTIRINPRTCIICVHEIIENDVSTAEEKSNDVAFGYLDLLKKAGYACSELIFDGAHFARMKSVLAEALYKKHGKYYLELDNGSKIWVDSSEGLEDETDDKAIRDRTDKFFNDLVKSESLLSDVDNVRLQMDNLNKALEVTHKQLNVLVECEISSSKCIQALSQHMRPNIPENSHLKEVTPWYFQ